MFDKCQEMGLFYITFQFKSTGVKNIPRCCRNTLLQCLLAHGLLNARKIVNKLKTTTTESKHTESQVPNRGPKGYRRFKNHQLHTIQRHSCSISRKKKKGPLSLSESARQWACCSLGAAEALHRSTLQLTHCSGVSEAWRVPWLSVRTLTFLQLILWLKQFFFKWQYQGIHSMIQKCQDQQLAVQS